MMRRSTMTYAGRGLPCEGRVAVTWEGSDRSGIYWRSYRCDRCGVVAHRTVDVVSQDEVPTDNELVVLTRDGGGFIYRTIEELLAGTNVDSVRDDVVFIVVRCCRIDFQVEYGNDHSLEVVQVAGGGRMGWVASAGVALC